MTKRPLHLLLLFIPVGFLIFFTFKDVKVAYKLTQYGINPFVISLVIIPIILLLYLILLTFIIRKKVNNKLITRANVLSWISIFAYGISLFFDKKNKLEALEGFSISILSFIILIIAGIFFLVGFLDREKFSPKP